MLLLPRGQWVFIKQKWECYPVEAISWYWQRAHWWSFGESECNSTSFTPTANTVKHLFISNFITHLILQTNSLLPLQNTPALLLSFPISSLACHVSFFEHTTQFLPFLTGFICCRHKMPIFLDALPLPNHCLAVLSIAGCLSFSWVFCLYSSPEMPL